MITLIAKAVRCGSTKTTLFRNCVMEFEQKEWYFSGTAPSLNDIRTKLAIYKGGEITCQRTDEGIATMCINYPEKRNAISGKMMLDFEKIVDNLEKWTNGKGVLLYGAGDIFSSGGDLNFARTENNSQSGYEMAVFMCGVLRRFSNLPLVSVAFVNDRGALGGGAEITTACDYRLGSADEKMRIGFVHSNMGIVPAWGGTHRLVQIVGKTKALDLILAGRLLDGEEALSIGLIDGIVHNFEESRRWLSQKVSRDVSVVRAAKAAVANAARVPDHIIETESRLFAPLWGGKANKEALAKHIKHM